MRRKLTLIMNGMFYGDGHTKLCLWTVFLLAVLTVGAVLTGLALRMPLFYALALVFAVGDFMLYRSLHLEVGTTNGESANEDELEEEIEKEKQRNQKENQKEKYKEEDHKKDHKEVRENPLIRGKQELKSQSSVNGKAAFANDTEEEKTERGEKDRLVSREKNTEIKENQGKGKEEISSKKEGRIEEFDFSEKEVKVLMHKYKVKKNHRPVMIDSCAAYHIVETPAYMWAHRGQVHFLVMEKEPRKISVPQERMNRMYFEKGVAANQKKEYRNLTGQSLMSVVFNEYKPTYYSVIRNNRQAEAKNLYSMGPDMKFTNTSVKELMLVLQPEFIVEDDVTKSDEYNQYFKQVYKQRILLDDGVMNVKEYQNKIRVILKHLSEAAITPAAVRMTLADMVKQHLISNDYANYYIQYNRKYREKHGK